MSPEIGMEEPSGVSRRGGTFACARRQQYPTRVSGTAARTTYDSKVHGFLPMPNRRLQKHDTVTCRPSFVPPGQSLSIESLRATLHELLLIMMSTEPTPSSTKDGINRANGVLTSSSFEGARERSSGSGSLRTATDEVSSLETWRPESLGSSYRLQSKAILRGHWCEPCPCPFHKVCLSSLCRS